MANGDLHRLGTLYVNGVKVINPTRPYYTTAPGASGAGDTPVYAAGAVEFRDTDATQSYKVLWREVNVGAKKLLIADRNLLCNISWNTLNTYGMCNPNGQQITIDGQPYKVRLLTNAEWDSIIVNTSNYTGLPVPTASDKDDQTVAADYTGVHNQFWNWVYMHSWMYDEYAGYRYSRGYYSAVSSSYHNPASTSPSIGWRPVLEVLNSAPLISDSDKSLGTYKTPVRYNYSVSEADGENFSISETLDGTVIRSLANQAPNTAFIIDLSSRWGSLSNGTHTLKIVATDVRGAASTRTLTFIKQDSPPVISDADRDLGSVKAPITVAYSVTEQEGETYTIYEYLDNDLIRQLGNQASGTAYSIDLLTRWAQLTNAVHSIKIIAEDVWGARSQRLITFTKNGSPPEAPRLMYPNTNMRVGGDAYVQFTAGSDPDGDVQTMRLVVASDSAFTQNVRTFSNLEKKVGNDWVSAENVTNADTGALFRIKAEGLQVNTKRYLRVGSTDEAGSNMTIWTQTVLVRVGTRLEIETLPFAFELRPRRITVQMLCSIALEATMHVYVCNNAFDVDPTWELADTAYKEGTAYTFNNQIKTASGWATAVRITVDANDATGDIWISSIGSGVA